MYDNNGRRRLAISSCTGSSAEVQVCLHTGGLCHNPFEHIHCISLVNATFLKQRSHSIQCPSTYIASGNNALDAWEVLHCSRPP